MEICEFKAWFEGFTEAMTKLPTVKQWARIKARIEEIDGTPTTMPVFMDRYWGRYKLYWSPNTWCNTSTVLTGSQTFTSNVSHMTGDDRTASLSANVAFTALGKAEAQSIGA